MLARLVCVAFCAFFASAAGCGGTVKQDPGEPSEQLRKGSADRCKAACVTLVACEIGAKSCSCSCPPCPVGATSCECPPCDCGDEKTTPASCQSSCEKAVKEVLDETPACDGAMLTLLDCVASATCKPHEQPCQPESRAVKECSSEHRGESSPPPAGPEETDPGSPGLPGTVVCNVAGASSSPGSPGTVCTSEWSECADGRTYLVECSGASGTALECTCIVDGLREASFPRNGCGVPSAEANAQCGWDLR